MKRSQSVSIGMSQTLNSALLVSAEEKAGFKRGDQGLGGARPVSTAVHCPLAKPAGRARRRTRLGMSDKGVY